MATGRESNGVCYLFLRVFRSSCGGDVSQLIDEYRECGVWMKS